MCANGTTTKAGDFNGPAISCRAARGGGQWEPARTGAPKLVGEGKLPCVLWPPYSTTDAAAGHGRLRCHEALTVGLIYDFQVVPTIVYSVELGHLSAEASAEGIGCMRGSGPDFTCIYLNSDVGI